MPTKSFELTKHEWKFGKTRNAVGILSAGGCCSQSFDSRAQIMYFYKVQVDFSSYTYLCNTSCNLIGWVIANQ